MKVRFFDVARKLSYKSNYKPHKLGAIIVKGNKIIGMGFNKNRTHRRSNNKWKTLHAELDAILNAGREDLNGCDIYVYRETKTSQMALAKPCSFCFQLIKDVGIKNIYYSNSNGFNKETA